MRPISPTQAQYQILGQGQPLESRQPSMSQPSSHPLGRLPVPSHDPLNPRPTLPKSRTVNALSSFRQTIQRSKSTLNLQPRSSILSLQPRKTSNSSSAYTVDSTIDNSEYTPNNPGPYIWGHRSTAEWGGRFS